jgi:pyruvate,water dikinase
MTRLWSFIRQLVSRREGTRLSSSSPEELRAAFRARYHNFKLLLAANNKVLELMTELESMLKGDRPFGMSFIRANCTAISVNVFRIVQNLDQLAPGKYTPLYESFRIIQDRIQQVLSKRREAKDGPLILPFGEIHREMADEVGSKMANVGEVANNIHLPVPNGFVVTASAYSKFFEHNDLQTEIDRRLQSSRVEELDELYSLSADIQRLIIRGVVPDDLVEAIMKGYRELENEVGVGIRISMRSSALGEDGVHSSFAGQYRSVLNVSADDIIDTYKEIVASKYSLQAITYRLNRGILDEDIRMCVGCMAMINASSGGVTYSRNPLNIRDDSIIINSVWGLPRSVVDGSVAPDRFTVSRRPALSISEKEVRTKEHSFVCYPEEGVCRLDLTGSKSGMPSLEDEQILELARIAIRLETHYGSPQDIEWAIDLDGSIYVLQCRPLRQISEGTDPERANRRKVDAGSILLEGGSTGAPGVAYGPVFAIRKNSDVLQFPTGAVLVAHQALPRWAVLLSRASALITEQGSVAGHLANVAREFGVPALFGVAGAVEQLTNGSEVTVDADGLRIYRGRVEGLSPSSVRCNLMEGSPVHDVLKEVAREIIPLNLIDPDAAEFRPANCMTLHDITRFCHEKSVKEMFNFGKDHHFSERASKQLVCDVAMQWWVINLDDGFKEDVPGKFVHLENIVCVPMLSLWEGITAVPWQGPPPVDARGFMSVLLEASANPDLDPSMPSAYAERNYFMISRHFCSLNSRFGFHFSTIETLVGERPTENYIGFQFKGGAADYSRRLRRARFVGSILDELGFRVEMKEDGVFARLEGYEEEQMKIKLKVLGYLLIHTRQLDMIMSNDASYNQHRLKIMNDISMLANPSMLRLSDQGGTYAN